MSKWKPIDSVPRDGRRVLLLVEPLMGRWDNEANIFEAVTVRDMKATHWMPLPGPDGVDDEEPAE